MFSKFGVLLAVLVFSIFWPAGVAAYSVLSHEAIIDSAWDTNIKPLLLKRFPGATAEELREAHGYAYGGAIIQGIALQPSAARRLDPHQDVLGHREMRTERELLMNVRDPAFPCIGRPARRVRLTAGHHRAADPRQSLDF